MTTDTLFNTDALFWYKGQFTYFAHLFRAINPNTAVRVCKCQTTEWNWDMPGIAPKCRDGMRIEAGQ